MPASGSRVSRLNLAQLRYPSGSLVVLLGALVLSSCHPIPAEPRAQSLRFLTGIALEFSESLLVHYNATIPRAHLSLEVRRGSLVVVSAMHKGEGELGFAQADVVYLAYRRGIEEEVYPHTNLRGMAVLWVNNLYVAVRRDSPIHRIEDLRGKRVGVLRPGTSGERVTRIVFGAYGITYADMHAQFDRGHQLLARMQRGELDAAITSYPVPLDSLSRLDQSIGVRLIPVSAEILNQLRASYPFLRRVVIPSGTFHNQQTDIETVGTEYLLICRLDLSEELAYELTREFLEALPELAAHAEATLIDPGQAPATPIPLHPGAARYYREREILK